MSMPDPSDSTLDAPASEPWEAADWTTRPTIERLQVIHDTLADHGMCAYFRRGEPGQDPKGTCSFGCRDEPSCMTDRWGPYPSELLRELIHDLTAGGPIKENHDHLG